MNQQVQGAAQKNTRLARKLVWVAGVVNMALLFMMCANASNGAAIPIVLFALLIDIAVAVYAINQGLVFELLIENIWKKTCSGLGGNFVGQGRAQYHTKVRLDPISSVKDGEWKRKTIYPKLRDVRGSWKSFTGTIHPFLGQSIDDYNKIADRAALAFRVSHVAFNLTEDGLIRIRAGQVPVPGVWGFPGQLQAPQPASNTRLLQQTATPSLLSIDELPEGVLKAAEEFQRRRGVLVPNGSAKDHRENVWADELALLKGVPVCRDLEGRVVTLPIEGNHWLEAARTNGGKGSWIWSLVLGLAPAHRLGLVKFWGIDPKMIELAIGREWWAHYADDDESSVELLEQCVKDMHARTRKMQGVTRKFRPTVETPLNVIIVDEMGYLSTYMVDRKLRERANNAIAAILAKGRAPGYALVGALQDPRKETCAFRDLFSIRIAGGLPAPMVDLVLGEGMHDAGAYCEQIPLSEPGVAYVISETTLKPICVRAAWCSDDDIQGMSQSASSPPHQPMGSSDAVKDEDLSNQQGSDQPLQQWNDELE